MCARLLNSVKVMSVFVMLSVSLALQAQPQTITLEGEIKNFPEALLTFRYQPYSAISSLKTEEAHLDGSGHFEITFESDAAIRGFFSLGKVPVTETYTFTTVEGKDSTKSTPTFDPRLVYVYMMPGEKLAVSVDADTAKADSYKTTLQFAGDHTDNSYFMNYEDQKFNQYKHRFLKNWYTVTSYEPAAFLQLVNKEREEKLAFINSTDKYDISPELRDIFKWKYIGDAVTRKLYYPSTRSSYLKEETKLPDGYYDFIDKVILPDESSHLGVSYYYFLSAYLKKKYDTAGPDKSYYDYVATVLEQKPLYEYYAFALKGDFKKELYDKFDENCPYPELAAKVRKSYKHLENMLPGTPAPSVVLADSSGNTIPLTDFKGSYVYIDFWATWCGPCIKEIPSLQVLERELHDKNITFVSISFDDEEDLGKWKNFIKRRNLKGVQLWVDADNKAKFSKAFNIQQIPRFVIIDPKGNIVDANAQRPSDEKLKATLLSLEDI